MKIGIYFEGSPKMGGGFFQSLQSCLLLNQIPEYKNQMEQIITDTETKSYLEKKNLKYKFYKKNKFLRYYSKLFEINLIKDLFYKLKIIHPFTSFIKKQKYDLIIFLGPSMMTKFCGQISFVSNIWDLDHKKNSQFPEHTFNHNFEEKEKLINDIIFRTFKIIIPHKSLEKDLTNIYKVESDKIQIQNFIPYLPTIAKNMKKEDVNFKQIFQNFNLPNNKKIIFYPAQFWPHKNHQYIIDTAEILKKNNDEKFHFVFCGAKKNNYEYISHQISSKGLDHYFSIYDFLNDNEVIALYKNSDALVMPTYCGPTNLPIYEAFFFKKIIFYTKGLIKDDPINDRLVEIDASSPSDFRKKLSIFDDKQRIDEQTEDNFKFYNSICSEEKFKENYKKIIDEFSYLLKRWK